MSYLGQNPAEIVALSVEHLTMVGIALLISLLIALPLGILMARSKQFTTIITGALGTLYTIPSIALLILLLPIFGLNQRSVIAALVVYTQIILVRNIVAGLQGVSPILLEAAKGAGMNSRQRWLQVQLPLALPVILAGVRLATVVAIAIATIGAKFGAGGLGTLLFDGIAQNRYDKIVAGSFVVALLALVMNYLFLALEDYFNTEKRIRRQAKPNSGNALTKQPRPV